MGIEECKATYSLFMICIVIVSAVHTNLASADAADPFALPAITITAEGTINPQDASIGHIGDLYFLTESITGYCIKIQRSNITLDGMGNTLRGKGEWFSSNGILINAQGVTVKNITITKFGAGGIYVNGSGNTITENTIVSNNGGVGIDGQYNEITKNVDLTDGVNIYNGELNRVTYNGNKPFQMRVEPDASNNVVVGNNLTLVDLTGNYNMFYLNNFHKKFGSGSIFLSNPPTSGNRFDNGTVGNFWASEYSGVDSNGDGIGDTPRLIGENISDNYPLTSPVNLTAIIPTPSPTPSPTITPTENPNRNPTSSLTISPSPTIPEFPSWTILLLALIIASLAAISKRKRD